MLRVEENELLCHVGPGTVMGNFMLAPKIGPVQPYGLAGLGLIRTSVEGVGTSDDKNQIGWDLGGGLMVFTVE